MTTTAPSACPRCAAEAVVPVVWGMPGPDDFERAARGEIALGGCCVHDEVEGAASWACSECGHQVTVATSTNDSPIGRLLEEISWEGNARTYRDGGRGRENVLTTEVFALLDALPRIPFLGAVLRAAHGADAARMAGIADVEQLSVLVLPGDVRATHENGSPSEWAVQPDVRLESLRTTVWVEAKRIRSASFQEHQIARTLQAMLTSTGHEVRLLVLLLGSPPPVKVKGLGKVAIADTVAHSTSTIDGSERKILMAASHDAVAWLTWEELATAVRAQAELYSSADPSTVSAVRRTTAAIERAITWHS